MTANDTTPLWQTPCPWLRNEPLPHYEGQCNCNNTGLKYPGLSTEYTCPDTDCKDGKILWTGSPYLTAGDTQWIDCTCNGTGRIEKQGPEAVAAYWAAIGSLEGSAWREVIKRVVWCVAQTTSTRQYIIEGAEAFIGNWARQTPEQHLVHLKRALEAATEVVGD